MLSQFREFRILSFCGAGAFGEVYRAMDISGQTLALKLVDKSKIDSSWEKELHGLRHYRQLAEQTHSLISISHVGEDEHYLFYTMELADGRPDSGDEYMPETLESLLKRVHRLPPERILEIARHILDGLEVLHNAGLVHRDIKPANILFVHGTPKIGDIGLLTSEQSIQTKLAGTLAFLPPERRSADSSQVTQQDDLYALGKLIYCMFSGNAPEEYPVLPSDQLRQPACKQLNLLANQLCSRVPQKRISRIPALRKAFNRTENNIRYGESRGAVLLRLLNTAGMNVRVGLLTLPGTLRKYWLLTLLLFAAIGWMGYKLYRYWPEPPFDINKIENRDYTCEKGGFRITIPDDSIFIDAAKISAPEKLKLPAALKNSIQQITKQAVAAIFLHLKPNVDFADNICIYVTPGAAELADIFNNADEASGTKLLARIMHQQVETVQQTTVTIRTIQKTTLDHHPAYRREYQLGAFPAISFVDYVIFRNDLLIRIELAAADTRYPRLRAEFDAMMRTFKIIDKK